VDLKWHEKYKTFEKLKIMTHNFRYSTCVSVKNLGRKKV